MSNYNCTEREVKKKATNVPIAFEEIVTVIIIVVIGLSLQSRQSCGKQVLRIS